MQQHFLHADEVRCVEADQCIYVFAPVRPCVPAVVLGIEPDVVCHRADCWPVLSVRGSRGGKQRNRNRYRYRSSGCQNERDAHFALSLDHAVLLHAGARQEMVHDRSDVALLQQLARYQTPVVRIAGYKDGTGATLATPEREAGRMAVAHLIACGHRRIAMVAPPVSHHAAAERLLGYHDALAEARLPVESDLIVRGRFDVESGQEAVTRLLALDAPPTAIYAANDEMALGVMRAAREHGLRVPEDVSVIGFDDTPSSRSAWPPLTTVRQPLSELSAAAVDLIVSGDGADAFDCRFSLVERASVADLRKRRT